MGATIIVSQKQLAIFTMALLLATAIGSYGYWGKPTLTGFATSQIGNFSANVATYLACTWSDPALSITFGSNLNPGDLDINATGNQNVTYVGNYSMYNVTVSTISNVQANITMLGADFVSGSNLIGVNNITWASNSTQGNATNLVPSSSTQLNISYNQQQKVAVAESIGSTVWYRFWLDIPNGSIAGSYTSNYTQLCSQAV
jgi:hypothetical protein